MRRLIVLLLLLVLLQGCGAPEDPLATLLETSDESWMASYEVMEPREMQYDITYTEYRYGDMLRVDTFGGFLENRYYYLDQTYRCHDVDGTWYCIVVKDQNPLERRTKEFILSNWHAEAAEPRQILAEDAQCWFLTNKTAEYVPMTLCLNDAGVIMLMTENEITGGTWTSEAVVFEDDVDPAALELPGAVVDSLPREVFGLAEREEVAPSIDDPNLSEDVREYIDVAYGLYEDVYVHDDLDPDEKWQRISCVLALMKEAERLDVNDALDSGNVAAYELKKRITEGIDASRKKVVSEQLANRTYTYLTYMEYPCQGLPIPEDMWFSE